MSAKNNTKQLTKKAFYGVRLDDLKTYYKRIFDELGLTKPPIRVSLADTRDVYIDRLLPILNANKFYSFEGKQIYSDLIERFIDRVKSTGFIEPKNENNKEEYQQFFFLNDNENDKQPMDRNCSSKNE